MYFLCQLYRYGITMQMDDVYEQITNDIAQVSVRFLFLIARGVGEEGPVSYASGD
jgi:hypothetical protein